MMIRRTFLLGLVAASLFGVTIPRPAGEVDIRLPDGKQVLLSNQRGKIVVLTFVLST